MVGNFGLEADRIDAKIYSAVHNLAFSLASARLVNTIVPLSLGKFARTFLTSIHVLSAQLTRTVR
jgi:hypothetical protein